MGFCSFSSVIFSFSDNVFPVETSLVSAVLLVSFAFNFRTASNNFSIFNLVFSALSGFLIVFFPTMPTALALLFSVATVFSTSLGAFISIFAISPTFNVYFLGTNAVTKIENIITAVIIKTKYGFALLSFMNSLILSITIPPFHQSNLKNICSYFSSNAIFSSATTNTFIRYLSLSFFISIILSITFTVLSKFFNMFVYISSATFGASTSILFSSIS